MTQRAIWHDGCVVWRPPLVEGSSPRPDRQTAARGVYAIQEFRVPAPNWEDLATLGAFAEQYVHPDPPSAVAKLRNFAEQVVQFIYHKHGLPKPYQCNLNDLLTTASFAQVVPKVVQSKLHSLRIHGNKGAHGESVLASDCGLVAPGSPRTGLLDAPELRQRQEGGLSDLCSPACCGWHRSRKEAQAGESLHSSTAGRSRSRDAEALGRPGGRPFHGAGGRGDGGELQAVLVQGQRVADTLAFDEATTRRRLIDSTACVCQLECRGQRGPIPNRSARSSRSIISRPPPARARPITSCGATTASRSPSSKPRRPPSIPRRAALRPRVTPTAWRRCTASVPIIFYTNGYDIWIWNDAAGEPPRKLYGFYSKDSLEYLHLPARRTEKPAIQDQPESAIAGRMYQIEAIKRVVERFAAKTPAGP